VIEGTDYTPRTIQLEPGDALILYSDGIPDALNQAGESFDRVRWLALLEAPTSSGELIDHLTEGVLEFMGEAPQYDDISILTVKRHK